MTLKDLLNATKENYELAMKDGLFIFIPCGFFLFS